jgi:hypothetical protein
MQIDMSKRYLIIVISIVIAACTPTSNPVAITPTATQPACQPSVTQTSNTSFPEIRGTMKTDGELWALLFFNEAHAKQDEKIVWRISGTGGNLTILARNEAGKVISPVWGPEYHGSSNWDRPGDEWGTGFNFPEAGCWTLTVTYGPTIGEISLDVLGAEGQVQ